MPDISKVILNGVTQMDVTQDSVAPGTLLAGETATMNNGTRTVGTLDLEQYALKAMLAPVEATTTSTDNYFPGNYLICQDNLRVVTEPIGVNQTIDNSNSQIVLMADELCNAFTALQRSLGADAYEPTGYATSDYPDGFVVLCGGQSPGLYEVYEISTGDYIPSCPEVVEYEIIYRLRYKADIYSPTFSGTPRAPTATAGTNTTQIATTAFVQTAVSGKANTASPALTGTPTAPTASYGTATTQLATTAFVDRAIARASRPNLLHNWYWCGGGTYGVFPINQRGASSYSTAEAYTIDRWYIYSAGASLTLSTNGLQVTLDSVSKGFGQTPPLNAAMFLGKTVTLSALFSDGSLYTTTGTIPSSLPSSSTTYLSVKTSFAHLRMVYSTVSSKWGVGFYRESGYTYTSTSATIVAVKLEFGSDQTLCHNEGTLSSPVWVLNDFPDFDMELSKCQRYYWNACWPSTTSGQLSMPVFNLGAAASTTVNARLTMPTPMRASPSVIGTIHSIRGTQGTSTVNLVSGLTLAATGNVKGNVLTFGITHSSNSFPAYSSGLWALFTALSFSADI